MMLMNVSDSISVVHYEGNICLHIFKISPGFYKSALGLSHFGLFQIFKLMSTQLFLASVLLHYVGLIASVASGSVGIVNQSRRA